MVVYVVLHCIDYEGCDIEAVFSSRSKAEKLRNEKMGEIRMGRYRVEKWSVNKESGGELEFP